MTAWMLVYVLLGVLLAWPCGWLLRRVLKGRQPLRCVQPYRPNLPQSESPNTQKGGMTKAP